MASSSSGSGYPKDRAVWRKKIVQRAQGLQDYQYVHLYRLVHTDPHAKFSKNKNGVFINLSLLDDETLRTVDEYLVAIESQATTDILNDPPLPDPPRASPTDLRKLEYNVVYHECYHDLTHTQKALVKKCGDALSLVRAPTPT
jgi:hypothetical protein